MKSKLGIAVILALVLSLLGSFALADEAKPMGKGECEGYNYVYFADGTAWVTGVTDSGVSELVIPEELDGYTVTGIGDEAFGYCYSLTSITISGSVTKIGANPFVYCLELQTVTVSPENTVFETIDDVLFDKVEKKLICYPAGKRDVAYSIPQGIESIGDKAFYCCHLTSITIPNSVTSIGVNPFALCYSLQTVKVSSTHPSLETIDDVLFDKVEKKLVWYPLTKTDAEYTVPQGIESIGDYAFYCCSLTSITIPNSVTHIGDYAFSTCWNLTSVTIPNSVTSIGKYAFHDCRNLTGITIPDSVTIISDSAFANCDNLTGITIPDSVTIIGDDAFYSCNKLASVTIPNSVTSIGEDAFRGCDSLTSVTIPESVTVIGDYAFYGCPKLTLTVTPFSYAGFYAKENKISTAWSEASTDWLNN